MRDRNGKTISVGSRVKLEDGTTARVSLLLGTAASVQHAETVEVIEHKGEHDKAADGDTIVWGT